MDAPRTSIAWCACAALLWIASAPGQEDGAAGAAGGWRLDLATPEPAAELAPGVLEGWDLIGCAGCHETIAGEWARTMHAFSWVDGIYRKELKTKRRPESCHGCHIPRPLHLLGKERFGRKPPPRTEEDQRLSLGISCRTCHQGPERTILGPWGEPTDAHDSVRSEHFDELGSNALCLSCHRTTIGPVIGVGRDFEAARLEERGMSCVGCHMAEVERPMATDDDDEPTAVRRGRSHLLQTARDPRFLAQAFALEARIEDGATLVTIRNRAGHRVPGLVPRRIELHLEAFDGSGAAVAEARHTLDTLAYLPVDGSVDIVLAAVATEVRVRGLHHAPGAGRPIPFLDRTLRADG